MASIQPINVLAPPSGVAAVADGDLSSGSGTDNATALQAMITLALSNGYVPELVFPGGGGRAYRSSGLTITSGGLCLRGLGGKNGPGLGQPTSIVYGGSEGGTLIDIALSSDNLPEFQLEHIGLVGATDRVVLPDTLLKFRGTGGQAGALDSGSWLNNVWLQHCRGDALRIEGGATNFLINNGRIDHFGGYGIYATGSAVAITIQGQHTITSGYPCNGHMFLDGETAGTFTLNVLGLKLETNDGLNQTLSNALSVNPYDKRGLIRLGCNPNISSIQHRINIEGLELLEPFTGAHTIYSHSLFQITGSVATTNANQDYTEMVKILGRNWRSVSRRTNDAAANDEIRVIGGLIVAKERPPSLGDYDEFEFCVGKSFLGSQGAKWSNARRNVVASIELDGRTYANRETSPSVGTVIRVTDSTTATKGATIAGGGSNDVIAKYTGSNWIVV